MVKKILGKKTSGKKLITHQKVPLKKSTLKFSKGKIIKKVTIKTKPVVKQVPKIQTIKPSLPPRFIPKKGPVKVQTKEEEKIQIIEHKVDYSLKGPGVKSCYLKDWIEHIEQLTGVDLQKTDVSQNVSKFLSSIFLGGTCQDQE